jgi:single-stranded-DNA-specific exonuclease
VQSYLVPREWRLRTELPHSDVELEALIVSLQSGTGLSPVTLRVCLMRGLTSSEAIQEHLHPKFESITHPFKIRDMDLATERLGRARASGERVRIFGDYDVDGTTGAALLSWIFRDFGFTYDATQPDRFKDGYGLNVGAVETAASEGVKVLVTVDCGITSFDAAVSTAPTFSP